MNHLYAPLISSHQLISVEYKQKNMEFGSAKNNGCSAPTPFYLAFH